MRHIEQTLLPGLMMVLMMAWFQPVFSQHFEMSNDHGCAQAVVDYTNLHPSQGYSPVMFVTTGFTYSWDFGNGNTSTAENPAQQVFNTIGAHEVNYTVSIDTIGFEITKIVLDGYLGCDDPWPSTNVEVYLLIKDNNGNVLVNTESTADSYSVDPEDNSHLEWNLGALPVGSQIPLWLEIWDNDTDLIDQDDNCIDDEEGSGTMVAMQLPANNASGFFETTKVYTATTTNGALTITAYFNKPVIILTQTATVNVYPNPSAPAITPSQTEVCFGESMPVLNAAGNDINWYDDVELSNLVATGNQYTPTLSAADSTYTLYATQTDAIHGCTGPAATATVHYSVIAPPVIGDYTPIRCFGELMPEYSAIGSNLNWYSDSNLQNLVNSGNSYIPEDNSVGVHRFYITQSNEAATCVSQAAILEFEIISAVSAEITVSDVTCSGTSTGSATVNVSSGQIPYVYSWSNGSNNQTMTDVPAGEYTLTVRDANFCLGIFDALVQEPGEIEASSLVRSGFCPDDETGSIETWVYGGTPPYSYHWSDGSDDAMLEGVVPGTYTLTVTDANNCEAVISATITRLPEFADNVVITNSSCPMNSDGEIAVSLTGGSQPYVFNWSSGSNDTLISNLAAGMYFLTVTDSLDCRFQKEYTLTNRYDVCLVPSNVFTPNNDGKNDTWKIMFIELHPQSEVMVYSRSGRMVFNTTGYQSDWDGTHNDKQLPTGSYMYVIDLKDGSPVVSGYVDIVR